MSYRPLLFLFIPLLASCRPEKFTPPPPPPVAVGVATVAAQPFREWLEFGGRLEASETVDLRAKITGYVDSVAFQEGALVKKGDVLFKLDARPFQNELNRAKAEQERAAAGQQLAKTELDRLERLRGTGAVSADILDKAAAGLREATAAGQVAAALVEQATLNLEYATITAPIDGRIGRALVTPGNLVSAGSVSLAVIVAPHPLYCGLDVDETTLLRLSRLVGDGQVSAIRGREIPCQMGLADTADFPISGSIGFVDNRVDPQTGTMRVRAKFDNAEGKITPGLYARVRVPGGPETNQIVVAAKAISADLNQKLVHVVSKEGTAEPRKVTVGAASTAGVVISSGLQAGETIIVEGAGKVRPGMAVQATPVTATPNK